MNPFRARCLRPGVLPYEFQDDQSYATLVDRLLGQGSVGQIIGPHGSGKSTLLLGLELELKRRGYRPQLARLPSGARQLPWSWRRIAASPAGTVLLVDGFEQLTRVRRQLVRCYAALDRHVGWLVTSHTDCGWGTIYQTRVTAPIAQGVIDRLLAANCASDRCRPVIPAQLVEHLLHEHERNLREVLFSLYDWYEQSL